METGEILSNSMAASSSTPAGTIISYGGVTVPDGYLVCDGREVSRADYPNLYLSIGNTYGAGNGTTTFNLPDLRGEFLRGTGTATRNSGSGATIGVHQDATSLPIILTCANGGCAYQGYATGQNAILRSPDKAVYLTNKKIVSFTTTAGTTTAEKVINVATTRPTNTSVLYCIKY
ncbi:MAG TPA: phage tail protein [Bacilli bacterium]|nr:phage tail protein [Bacilli bacterium]